MLGRRWLEVKDHNGSAATGERIELQDNWVVTERISKGNKRCVTDVSSSDGILVYSIDAVYLFRL